MRGLLNIPFEPFDPSKHKPQDMGLGGMSTEYISGQTMPDGSVMNYPTIWFDPQGKAVLMDPRDAFDFALDYEARSGKKFPRYGNAGIADEFAMHRSAMGGAQMGLLAQ